MLTTAVDTTHGTLNLSNTSMAKAIASARNIDDDSALPTIEPIPASTMFSSREIDGSNPATFNAAQSASTARPAINAPALRPSTIDAGTDGANRRPRVI